MVNELRWILCGLSLLLLGGIWWWGARRARLLPKNVELRRPTVPAHEAVDAPPAIRGGDQPRDWGVPPFEPLNIHTANFDDAELDIPMTATTVPLDVRKRVHADESSGVPDVKFNLDLDLTREPGMGQPEIDLGDVCDTFDDGGPALEPEPHVMFDDPSVAPAPLEAAPAVRQAPSSQPGETQRIVTVRVSAQGEARWSGSQLRDALEGHELEYGRYKVFHRRHGDGRTLFCVASLVEPGTFDLERMPQEEFRGITMFAVLPGPADPLYAIDTLLITASDLAAVLNGVVQDSNGAPMSPQRAAAMREEAALQAVGHGHAGSAQ